MPIRLSTARAALIALAVVATACAPADATTQNLSVARKQTPTTETTTTSAPTTTTAPTTISPTTTTTTSTTTTEAPDPYETLIATARVTVQQLVAYESPDGPPMALNFVVPNPHQFGGPLTLRVVEGSVGDDWLKVQLPVRPNGLEGWIPTADYLITSTRIRAEVDLSARSVVVFDGPDVIAETTAAIGTASTPTPLGTFFIAAKRVNPPEESFLGTHALVLSSFSEALDTFSGGLPVIAIHGSNTSWPMGKAVSNGCVRVTNDVIAFMDRHVPLGAPVEISG